MRIDTPGESVAKSGLFAGVSGVLLGGWLLVAPPVLAGDATSDVTQGMEAAQQGSWDQALKLLQGASRSTARSPEAVFWLARSYEETGKYDQAEKEYLGWQTLADDTGKADEVKERICSSFLQSRELVRNFVKQAMRQMRDKDTWPQAGRTLEAARVLTPCDSDIHFLRGQLAMRKESFGDAVRCYRMATQFQPDRADLFGHLALAQFRAASKDGSRLDEAETSARTALSIRQKQIDAVKTDEMLLRAQATDHDLLGVLCYNSKRYKEAQKCFSEACKENGGNNAYLEHLHDAEAQLRKEEEQKKVKPAR